jgi:hypothetical protein
MKIASATLLLLCVLPLGSRADKPKVSRAMIKAMEDSVDSQLRGIWPADPIEIVAVTQGAYVSGSGLVLVSEVNLAPSTGISPFHPAFSAAELKRTHDKKINRLPKLRAAMQEMLLNSAGSLDTVPGEEQIALGITLFNWRGEDIEGLPAQIVMHGAKRALVDIKTGRADRTTLASVLAAQEF